MTDSPAEIENLRKKLDENSESLVFAPLADVLRKSGRLDEAVDVCRKGLEKHPHYAPARVVLGRVYRDQGKSLESEGEYKKVLEADPENLQALNLLGELYLSQKQFSAAIEEFQKVLALNPDDEATQSALKKAIEAAAFDQTKPEAPPSAAPASAPPASRDSTATLTIAELYLKQGHFDKAIEVYQELLAEDPQNFLLRQKLTSAVDQQQKHQSSSGGVASKIKKDEFTRPPDPVGDTIADEPKTPRRPSLPVPPRKKPEDVKFTSEDILQVMQRGGKDEVMLDEPVPVPPLPPPPPKPAPPPPPKPVPPPAVREAAPSLPTAPVSLEPALVAPPAAAPPSSSPALSESHHESLKGVLAELTSVEGIQGSFLAAEDGTPLVALGKTGQDTTGLGQVASAIFEVTRRAALSISQGNLQQVLITSMAGQILLVGTSKGVLVVLADERIKIGLLRLALDSSVKKIQKIFLT